MTESQLFLPTGSMETFVVPEHRRGTLRVTARGGRGRRTRWVAGTQGGDGGRISAPIDVGSGATLYVIVGDGAESAEGLGDGVDAVGEAGLGPFLGGEGGDGVHGGAGGGCASEVRGGPDVADRLLVAGGGGGGGDGTVGLGTDCSGGAGGLGRAAGSEAPASTPLKGGGATFAFGGAGGTSITWGTPPGAINGTDGGNGAGGDGGYVGFDAENLFGGSGGGGGFKGGGGGGARTVGSAPVERGPGGGGSSWVADPDAIGVTSDVVNPEGWTGSFVLFEWELCDPPIAAFAVPDPQVGPSPLTVTFDGTGSLASGSATVGAWHWNFGDGAGSSDAIATHTYTEPGTYEVSLTVYDSDECVSDVYTDLVIVTDATPATVGIDGDCIDCLPPVPCSAEITFSGQYESNAVAGYLWRPTFESLNGSTDGSIYLLGPLASSTDGPTLDGYSPPSPFPGGNPLGSLPQAGYAMGQGSVVEGEPYPSATVVGYRFTGPDCGSYNLYFYGRRMEEAGAIEVWVSSDGETWTEVPT